MTGIRISKRIGIGDAIQFTSVPENYFRHTGERLVDLEEHWVFDFNPHVLRRIEKCDKVINLWDAQQRDVPVQKKGRTVLLSNAEAHTRTFDYPVLLNRPRLYIHEDFPYNAREDIILHVKGRSHGQMPEHIVKHVLDKYGDRVLWLGEKSDWVYSFPPPAKQFMFSEKTTIWDSVRIISRCRMFIGVDSGPSWIAQCYPDVITKKVRLFPALEFLHNWVPLEWCRLGSYWDDRSAQIFNSSEDDAGFTWSYKRI